MEAEAREKGLDYEARNALRIERSAPVLASIKARLDADRLGGSYLPTSPLSIAVNYTAELWTELTRYAEPGNGMVEIDNNLVENAIRPSAIGKKNCLFTGHPKAGQRSAVIYTMVENCRMHGIDPRDYITDVIPRLPDREAQAAVTDLLPPQWKPTRERA